jgi:hypothetical protein
MYPTIFSTNVQKNHIQILYILDYKNMTNIVDLGMYIFSLQFLSDFVILCSPQYKEFLIKCCILMRYIIDFVQIYFYIFLKK